MFSPPEPVSATTPSESPSIDLTVPSPTFDLASVSRALTAENNGRYRVQPANRASDDFGKTRPRFLADPTRPATSGAGTSRSYTSQSRQAYSPEPTDVRDSPLVSSQRTSGDAPSRSSSRETQDDGHGSSLRSSTFAVYHGRGTVDDSTSAKGLSNKKSKFNLLNPMSLLARRRSSQNANKLEEVNLNVSTLHVPAIPDDFQPSIRGNIVHDFSAPRARKVNNENSPRPGPLPSPSYPRRPSEFVSPALPPSTGTPVSVHSPMFKEHFQEDRRPVQPQNTAYLHGQHLQVPASGTLPSFAKRLPVSLPNDDEVATKEDVAVLVKEDEEEEKKQKESSRPPEPTLPPPPPPQRTPSPVLDLPPAGALPKHMTSTSSRFSFQIGQQGSIAQEKFLEEKHKEHAAKRPADVRLSVASIDDMNDFDDYENGIDEDDGFDMSEITIKNIDMPSSQADQQFSGTVEEDYGDVGDDDDELGTGDIVFRNIDVPTSQIQNSGQNIKQLHRQSLQAFHFTPQSLTFSPSTAQHTSESTPRDFEGFPIGMAEAEENDAYSLQPRIRDSMDPSPDAMFFEGLGISTAPQSEPKTNQPHVDPQPFDDSDLYFDDGEFDDHIIEAVNEFDEDMLDDVTQIKDIPAENARKFEEASRRSVAGGPTKVVAIETVNELTFDPSRPSSFMRAESPESSYKLPSNEQPGLTEGNLAAYHDALAMAANAAAASGKFDRSVSFSQASDDETDSSFHNSVPGWSSRGSRYSNNMMSSGLSDEDGFGLEDDMDDDAMIAAANAEALENDDDGFYGQEFGFYARAHGRDTAEFLNGGYFTSRGSNGIKRSHSGKNNFQEPSLTPITERSEFSTRNSVVSFPAHTGIPGNGISLPSPGIADLLNMDSPIVDDEMSISTLMKLRRGFGGSSTSINSLGERHHVLSSPLAHAPGYSSSLSESIGGRISSPTAGMGGLSIAESEDEDEDGGRPTITQNTPHKVMAAPSSQSSQEQLASSPMSRKGNHSRNSSGAESVSYARDNEGRWVLERRRTGDDGELELIARQYLAGTRI